MRSSTSASNLARVSFIVRCFRPKSICPSSRPMKGRLISVCVAKIELSSTTQTEINLPFIGRDEGQIDFGLRGGRQLDLRLLSRLLEPLQRELVLAQVDALLFLEFVGEIVHQAHVEVFAAEER